MFQRCNVPSSAQLDRMRPPCGTLLEMPMHQVHPVCAPDLRCPASPALAATATPASPCKSVSRQRHDVAGCAGCSMRRDTGGMLDAGTEAGAGSGKVGAAREDNVERRNSRHLKTRGKHESSKARQAAVSRLPRMDNMKHRLYFDLPLGIRISCPASLQLGRVPHSHVSDPFFVFGARRRCGMVATPPRNKCHPPSPSKCDLAGVSRGRGTAPAGPDSHLTITFGRNVGRGRRFPQGPPAVRSLEKMGIRTEQDGSVGEDAGGLQVQVPMPLWRICHFRHFCRLAPGAPLESSFGVAGMAEGGRRRERSRQEIRIFRALEKDCGLDGDTSRHRSGHQLPQ